MPLSSPLLEQGASKFVLIPPETERHSRSRNASAFGFGLTRTKGCLGRICRVDILAYFSDFLLLTIDESSAARIGEVFARLFPSDTSSRDMPVRKSSGIRYRWER